MYWPHAYRMPKWILTTAAAGMLAIPVVAQDQIGLSPATGKPTLTPSAKTNSKPKSRSNAAAPAVPAAEDGVMVASQTQGAGPSQTVLAQGTVTDGESPVQKELRRLYQENGREAPEIPTPAQVQSINGRSPAGPPSALAPAPAAPVAPYGTYGAAPQRTAAAAPAPSAPRTPRRNPVTSFFQRITGRDSKPANPTAAAGTTGPVTNPTVPMRPAPPPARNYAPYNGTQPQRLAEQGPATSPPVVANPMPATPVVKAPVTVPAPAALAAKPAPAVAPRTTPPVVQPRKEALPPVTVNVAEKLQLESDVPPAAPAPVRAEIIAAPQVPMTPVVTGPQAQPSFTARTTPEEEPVFEEPVMVDAEAESPFEAPVEVELGEEAPMPAEAPEVAIADPAKDFPEPFPEEDEEEADEEAMESPFSGLALDEEEPIVAQPLPMEAVPQTEVAAEPAPLAVPVIAAEAAPAPTAPAIEPEEPARIVAAPVAAAPVGDDEFFPADVAKPVEEKPATDEPVLSLPPEPVAANPKTPEEIEYASKMQKIKDRGGMKGLKGFCPVTLRDERELKDAKPEFHAQYRGQKFHFASAEAKAKFEQSPGNYAPAAYGADVVVLIRDKDVAEGTLDYAAWFKGQLYLFSSEATHAVFSDDPAKFASPVGIE